MTLTELRDALAKATGPDAALDEALWHHFHPQATRHEWPDYTASIDAAVTLVPDDEEIAGIRLKWNYTFNNGAMRLRNGDEVPTRGAAFFWVGRHDKPAREISAFAATPALALCLARIEYEIARAALKKLEE